MRYQHTISIIAGLLASMSAIAATPDKDSLVNMSWQQSVRRDLMTSGAQMVVESDLEHGPVADMRKRLKGQILSLEVLENCGGLGQSGVITSPYINSDQLSIQSRCFWNIACIIDDVPVPMNQFLFDPNQIESMTFITDIADKIAYGPVAAEGAFIIRTKKGGYNTPLRITADFEAGIETPGIWPEYCNGEQFAILNNIAREQAGYAPLYTAEDIRGFANGSANDPKYPNVDYRSVFFRKTKPVSRFGFNANAGSNNVKFNTSLNGQYGSDLVQIGPQSYFSKLNLNSSVSAKIGQYIEANASFIGLLTMAQDGNGVSFGDVNNTPPIAFPLTLQVDPESEYYDPQAMSEVTTVYGVSKVNQDNIYAQQIEGGYGRAKRRSGMFNATIDFDMSWLLPGLKSKTFANIETFFTSTIGKTEDYLGFYWDRNTFLDGRSSTHIGTKMASEYVMSTATFQSFNAYERLSYDWSNNGHAISSSLTGWLTSAASTAKKTNTRILSGIATLKYSYADRYVLDLVASYSGTTQFKKGKRTVLSPAAGFAWNMDKESFMQDIAWIGRLKIRGQVGQIGDYDIYGKPDNEWQSVFSWHESSGYHFGPNTGTCWFGQLTDPLSPSGPDRFPNEELTWPVIFETDLGFEATLFHGFDISFNWYDAVQKGVIGNVGTQQSSTLGNSQGGGSTYKITSQAANYDQYTYRGWEIGLNWHKDWDDFGFSIGASARHWNKINDIVRDDFYIYDYQKASGRKASEWRGYIYDGIFQTQEEIDSTPTLTSETKIGDIKYKDVNGDGKLDANDKMFIGCSNADIRYSINLGISYKKFDLNVVGTGQAGLDTYLSSIYFMGGYSDMNYSKFLWDTLKRDANGNVTAYGEEFPRLSYLMNSNNFQCSSYWLRNGNWFKVQSAELAYTTDFNRAKWVKSVRVSLRGSNLLCITGIKYIDPEGPVSGIQAPPIYRAFTLGAKFTF